MTNFEPTLSSHTVADLQRLQSIVEDAGERVFDFPALTDADCQIIGKYIQYYNYIEMNLRRCLEILCRAGIASNQNNYQLVQSAQIIPITREALESCNFPERLEFLSAVNLVGVHWDFRHKLAHWAAKRFPNDDAIVLFTKDGREMRRIGHEITDDTLSTGIARLQDIRRALNELEMVDRRIGEITSALHLFYIRG